jgi:hypothetical protein
MLILPEFNRPYLIDSLDTPMVAKYNWIFNAELCDFLLNPIVYLEETSGAAYKIRVNGSEFWVPTNWSFLATDLDTYQLDTIPFEAAAKSKSVAFAFLSNENKLRTFDVEIINYISYISVVHPMINKGTAMVHPVGPILSHNKELHASIVIGPYDLNKFMGVKTVGDVFA